MDDSSPIRYVGKINSGAYADIVLCLDEDDALFAVKVYKPSGIWGQNGNNLRELIISRMIPQHPFVVHSPGVLLRHDLDIFLMLQVGNPEWFTKIPWLDYNVIRALAFQLLTGLHHLHTHGFAHRDLKLQNIIGNFDGHLMIADLGSARLGCTIPCTVECEWTDTADTEIVGTHTIRAPEVWLCSHKAGMASDMWAAGVIIMQLCLEFRKEVFGRHQGLIANIWKLLGKPDTITHEFTHPFPRFQQMVRQYILTESFPTCGDPIADRYRMVELIGREPPRQLLDVIQLLLQQDPSRRPSTADVLTMPLFDGITIETSIATTSVFKTPMFEVDMETVRSSKNTSMRYVFPPTRTLILPCIVWQYAPLRQAVNVYCFTTIFQTEFLKDRRITIQAKWSRILDIAVLAICLMDRIMTMDGINQLLLPNDLMFCCIYIASLSISTYITDEALARLACHTKTPFATTCATCITILQALTFDVYNGLLFNTWRYRMRHPANLATIFYFAIGCLLPFDTAEEMMKDISTKKDIRTYGDKIHLHHEFLRILHYHAFPVDPKPPSPRTVV